MATTDRNKFQFVTHLLHYFLIGILLATICTDNTVVHGASILQSQTTTTEPAPIIIQAQQAQSTGNNKIKESSSGLVEVAVAPSSFHPRVDYNNEWKPVGRGDPLQNDPTYDYSPPTLDRVRYWAESSDQKESTKKDLKLNTSIVGEKENNLHKHPEILLMGVRGKNPTNQHVMKNTKGEIPLVQPKYTSIRRSYYAASHQIPTHLMPPPMQQQHQQHTMMKGQSMGEYKHNVVSPSSMSSNYMSGPATMSMITNSHHQQYYPMHHMSMSMPSSRPTSSSSSLGYYPNTMTSSPVSSPWRHTSSIKQNSHVHSSQIYDSHNQESVNYFSYSRPSTLSSSTIYSPNAITNSNRNSLKQSSVSRKPWLHELLQKEIVKTSVKPTHSTTKYAISSSTKPIYDIYSIGGKSSTYSQVTFVTTTPTTVSSSSRIPFETSSSHKHISMMHSYPTYSTTAVPYPQPHFAMSSTPSTTSKTLTTAEPATTSSRLLIPNTSNLAFRPTVAPMEMTTDSLFKHYNQPEKPLRGPMYLIIEGHSKVKTYGKNDLDPHQPKIVPVISKREPVIRIADPNEKRGTLETFQVKHLHTKTSTTPKPVSTTTPLPASSTLKTSPLDVMITKRPSFSAKTKPTTTTAPTTTSTAKTTTTTQSPKQELKTTNEKDSLSKLPTGMQGLFSLLDDSLSGLFKEDSVLPTKEPGFPQNYVTAPSNTVLKPIKEQLNGGTPVIQPRIGSNAESIKSILNESDEVGDIMTVTTETVPRGVRQVFDYDDLPESRRKELLIVEDNNDGEDWLKSIYDDTEEMTEDDDVESDVTDYEDPQNHQLIKRIDKLVNDEVGDGDDSDDGDEDAGDDDDDGDGEDEFEELDAGDDIDEMNDDDLISSVDDTLEVRSLDSNKETNKLKNISNLTKSTTNSNISDMV